MEKQSSEASLGCLTSLANNSNSSNNNNNIKGCSSSYSKLCLSPHNGMPSPPLWTDDVMLHLSPPPLFSSPKTNNNSSSNNNKRQQSCLSSITPPSTRRLATSSHHNSSHAAAAAAAAYNNNHADHSEGHYLLDDDSFGNASVTHYHHSHSHQHNNTSSRGRSKQHRQQHQHNRFCVQRVIRDSCWYAASAVQPTSHSHGNNSSSSSSSSKRATTKKTWRLFYTSFKVLVVAACAGFVYDSHHRVRTHKQQMQEYESERAHILEQMIWIDTAAKKVHKKYSSAAAAAAAASLTTTTSSLQHNHLAGKITTTSATTATTGNRGSPQQMKLQALLDKMQVRIQLNARDWLAQKFGDKPAQVSLQISKRQQSKHSSSTSTSSAVGTSGDNQHLVVALSDDTPHATATFVQQIDAHYWDDLEFETITTTTTGTDSSSSDGSMVQAIQILSRNRTSASPLLEFVEPSRKCHSVGSVALRQVRQGPLHHVLVLRIYLTEQPPTAAQAQQRQYGNEDFDIAGDNEEDEQEVCIGKVLHGLDHALLPELLIVQQERQHEMEQQDESLLVAPLQRKEPRLQQRQVLHDRRDEEQELPPEPRLQQQQGPSEEYHGGPSEKDIPIELLILRERQPSYDGNERHDRNGGNDNIMEDNHGNIVHNEHPASKNDTKQQQQQQQRLRGPSLLATMKAGVAAKTARDVMHKREEEKTPSFVPLKVAPQDAEGAQDWLHELLPPSDATMDTTGGSRIY
jgi:hypothetical protein